jgi:hypothetical protein
LGRGYGGGRGRGSERAGGRASIDTTRGSGGQRRGVAKESEARAAEIATTKGMAVAVGASSPGLINGDGGPATITRQKVAADSRDGDSCPDREIVSDKALFKGGRVGQDRGTRFSIVIQLLAAGWLALLADLSGPPRVRRCRTRRDRCTGKTVPRTGKYRPRAPGVSAPSQPSKSIKDLAKGTSRISGMGSTSPQASEIIRSLTGVRPIDNAKPGDETPEARTLRMSNVPDNGDNGPLMECRVAGRWEWRRWGEWRRDWQIAII